MSVLKSILHHWNKSTKSYDTLHPETEVSQITDFADGLVSKLAATTAISAISALQADSRFGQMMKWVLDASGVKYLIDTNGYVCFGSLFGGLIIQWGICIVPSSGNSSLWNFPLAFPTGMMNALACVADPYANGTYRVSIGETTKNYARIVSTITGQETVVYCFAIGK